MNMFKQDESYTGNYDIWAVCFDCFDKSLYAKFDRSMRPRGYFLITIMGHKLKNI